MNCREAQSQMFAPRDEPPDASGRASLEAHVAHCATCQRMRDNLAAAVTAWRTESINTTVPDAELEWHAVRRRIRGGDVSPAKGSRPRRNWFAWLALPLGTAAAAAIALVVSLPRPAPKSIEAAPALTARADSVEAPGNNASTMVFVDDKSGWLIVWASDAVVKQG